MKGADPGFSLGGAAGSRGAVSAIEKVLNLLSGRRMVEKASFCAIKALLLAGWSSNLLRRATSWTKRAPSLIRMAHMLAGRRPHNAFGVKTDPELR